MYRNLRLLRKQLSEQGKDPDKDAVVKQSMTRIHAQHQVIKGQYKEKRALSVSQTLPKLRRCQQCCQHTIFSFGTKYQHEVRVLHHTHLHYIVVVTALSITCAHAYIYVNE